MVNICKYPIVPWMVWVFFLGFSVKDHVVREDDPSRYLCFVYLFLKLWSLHLSMLRR